MTATTATQVRITGGIYDRDKPGAEPVPGNASRYTYLAPVKCAALGLAVIDHGAKIGRKVYHVPSDGAPGLAVPAMDRAKRRLPGLVDGSSAGFRTLRDARAYMLAVAESGILPTDRAATRDDVQRLAEWLSAYIDKERGNA